MASKTKIAPETIVAAQKMLRSLPVRDTRKSPEEAMELLAGDFQNAIRKGYDPRTLRHMLAERGLKLPLSLVKRYPVRERKIPRRNIAAEKMRCEAKNMEEQAHSITVKPDTPDTEL